ncbi:MAG: maltose alpha-D-glucosyltransferase [Verrucomicrobiota bacterium]
MTVTKKVKAPRSLPKEPLWYKTAVIYELHVRSFYDSNADGIGDFPGLTEKLDYLQDLGVTALWLLPFYPSPLKDDGYDIADYYSINPIYGTLKDFKTFLDAAHDRGLRVITELVVNHTSDQHPWFQRSRRAKPGSAWRDFYVWSDTPEKYKEARIIFKDFEPSNWSWDPLAQAYFWHRFYSHQPDLNYDHPEVHAEILRVLDFWLDMGVDGLRLDAVPYLYEREGTSCENLPETHAYLKTLRRHVDEKYGDRMLLAEANQWPEDSVAYFGTGKGDECHVAFHFPLMPRLFMALRMEDRVPIIDILEQTPPIPETSQWAVFLRNHDELTLEMVTDEERDYMYRVYAQDRRARINLGIRRRLAPLLGNDRKRIELLNLLLLSLPGTPVLYYGDEIGMGDNTFLGDRNGVRTPMQWSSDKNAGFSRASPHALYLPVILDPEYHYETVNVEAQRQNPHSLLWWTKRVLALHKRWSALGKGTIEFLRPDNRKVLAFVRQHEQERILVVANLSRFPQPVSLDLAKFKEAVPAEPFGRTEFPAITDQPYPLTLSPHAIFWFVLMDKKAVGAESVAARICETFTVASEWDEILGPEDQAALEAASLLHSRAPLVRGKSKEVKTIQVRGGDLDRFLRIPRAPIGRLCSGRSRGVSPADRFGYWRSGRKAATRIRQVDHRAHSSWREGQREGILRRSRRGDLAAACSKPSPRQVELGGRSANARRPIPAARRRFALSPELPSLRSWRPNSNNTCSDACWKPSPTESGADPDLEDHAFYEAVPEYSSACWCLEYLLELAGDLMISAALLSPADGPGCLGACTLDSLSRYFERVRTLPEGSKIDPLAGGSILELADKEIPADISSVVGTFLESARLLGQRTGEMHLALASDSDNRDFAPEPFTPFYQRGLYQSMRNLAVQNLQLIRRKLAGLESGVRPIAERVVKLEPEILTRLRTVFETRVSALRIRTHGDYHLGQVLYTGKDFMIIDFEGEPTRSLGERRIKRSPLRDVAGMIRSFDYVTYAALFRQSDIGNVRPEQLSAVEPWTRLWYRWNSATFLRAYLRALGSSPLIPRARSEVAALLNSYLLEKAIYEVAYELNHRPTWVKIPLQGILQLLEPGKIS